VNLFSDLIYGELTGPNTGRHIDAVIEYLDIHLSGFVSKYLMEYSEIENESGINQELSSYLERNIDGEPFYFQAQNMTNTTNGQSPSVDIGVKTKVNISNFSIGETYFSIEAKRLPLKREREKEYLIGHDKYCGGVERFKRGIHGKGQSISAILGYVQQKNFDEWFIIINSWIDELISDPNQDIEWNENDKLQKVYIEPDTAKFISLNKRSDDSIKLYHFWLNLVVT